MSSALQYTTVRLKWVKVTFFFGWLVHFISVFGDEISFVINVGTNAKLLKETNNYKKNDTIFILIAFSLNSNQAMLKTTKQLADKHEVAFRYKT